MTLARCLFSGKVPVDTQKLKITENTGVNVSRVRLIGLISKSEISRVLLFFRDVKVEWDMWVQEMPFPCLDPLRIALLHDTACYIEGGVNLLNP